MNYKSKLISKEIIADGTMAFHFERPKSFEWKAGQSIDLTLINPPETDEEGNTRAFSIAAPPQNNEIIVATRMRDTAFKRALNSSKELSVEIAGPFGSFTLHQNESRPAVMLVGGIGITPFISMLKDATYRNLPHKIYLFYSNRRPEDAAFLADLREIEKKNKNLNFVPTMTAIENSSQTWEGETGYITKEMIEKYAGGVKNPVYYTAGPLAMVSAMRKILAEMDISDDDIRTEEFSGY